jgi:hypothetical protein
MMRQGQGQVMERIRVLEPRALDHEERKPCSAIFHFLRVLMSLWASHLVCGRLISPLRHEKIRRQQASLPLHHHLISSHHHHPHDHNLTPHTSRQSYLLISHVLTSAFTMAQDFEIGHEVSQQHQSKPQHHEETLTFTSETCDGNLSSQLASEEHEYDLHPHTNNYKTF